MGGGGSADRAARVAKEEEEARQARVKQGTANLRGQFATQFNPAYFNRVAAMGRNLYTPGVNNQYEDARKQLQAALLRTGNAESTAAIDMGRALDEQRATALQNIEQNVKGTINKRRQNIADAEALTVQQLQASADPAAAAAQASNLIDINSAQEGWSPLGQVFTDATAGLATQADLERSGNARYNMGVSNWGNNSKRYMQNIRS